MRAVINVMFVYNLPLISDIYFLVDELFSLFHSLNNILQRRICIRHIYLYITMRD